MRLRHYLPLTLFCAALLAAAPTAASPQWKTFEPPSKLFTAQFPGVPTHESRVIDQGIRKETAHRYWLGQPGRDGGLFEVVHLKAPPNDGNLPMGVILDATIDTVIGQYNARGLRETGRRELTLNGCVAREFDAVDARGVGLHGRLFVAGEQIINAVYVGPANSAARQREGRRFLDSVTPTAACAPQPAEASVVAEVKKLGDLSGPRDAASGWMLIAPPASGFSVLMPGPAEAEEEKAQEKPYPLTLRTYTAGNGEASYVVVECGDFPPEMSRVTNFEEMKFNLAYRGLATEAEKLGLRIIPDGELSVSGHPSRRYRLSSDLVSGSAVVVSTPRKVYMFGAFAAGPKPPAADFARFFSSFKLAGN